MAKVVTLPLYVKDRAEKHARIALKNKKISEQSNKGKALFEKLVHQYCHDYYVHGLGQKVQNPKKETKTSAKSKNPYSPRISKKSYDLMPVVTGSQAPLLKGITDENEKNKIERKTRAPVTSLVQLYVQYTLGLDPKSSFNFKKGMDEKEKKKVVLNQYKRVASAAVLSEAIKRFLTMSPDKINELLNEVGIKEDLDVSELAHPKRRESFIKELIEKIK